MRRKDREVTDFEQIKAIIENCEVCRLGMFDGEFPYIVPMNFGYEFIGQCLILYFHCASEGRKIEILKENRNVCFEMDCGHKLITGDLACDYSYNFESIIGKGTASLINDYDLKIAALNILMENYSDMTEFKYQKAYVDRIAIIKVECKEYTAKKLVNK